MISNVKKFPLLIASLLSATFGTAGCQSTATDEPIRTAKYVDLKRFMGDWYVLAAIPTAIEREAFNAIESYALNTDGTVATTFSFNKGGFSGKRKTYNPKGFVRDKETNAVWGMQFIWPIKAEYRVLYVNADYTQTVIGRSKRDYLWIMARTPNIATEDYDALVSLVEAEGYETSKIRQVPQEWPEPESGQPEAAL